MRQISEWGALALALAHCGGVEGEEEDIGMFALHYTATPPQTR